MLQVSKSFLYQVNFPKSQSGKLSSVYYTILNSNTTEYVARTQTGVVEMGDGAYAVSLSFPVEGSWSILWEIDGTPYVGSTEINIYDDNISYVVEPVGASRNDSEAGVAITLSVQFLKNGAAYQPVSFDKVEIYNSYAKALTGLPADVIQTITSISSSGGLASYSVAAINVPRTYYDKIFITPRTGDTSVGYISPFYIHKVTPGVTPDNIQTCNVYLNLLDITHSAFKGQEVVVTLCGEYGVYGKTLIERDKQKFCSDATGLVTMTLIETDTMSLNTGVPMYYLLTVPKTNFSRKFSIPAGTMSANLLDLPVVA